MRRPGTGRVCRKRLLNRRLTALDGIIGVDTMELPIKHRAAPMESLGPSSIMTRHAVEWAERRGAAWTPLQLVRTCLQAHLTEEHKEQIRRQVVHGPAWEDVIRVATLHRVVPLFLDGLERAAAEHLPDTVQRYAEDVRHRIKIYNALLIQELGRVFDVLREAGIPVLTLKGPALAQVAYGSVHLRRYTDLDVLIPSAYFAEVEEMLSGNGYVPFDKVRAITGWKKQLYLSFSRQWPVQRAHGAFRLDVHTALMPPGYAYPVSFQTLWERSTRVALGYGVEVPRLAPEDALHVLCLHGAKNQWRELAYVCDVSKLVSTVALDWGDVVERARDMRGERVLQLGLHLAARVLGAPVPTQVLDALDASAAFEHMAQTLETKLHVGMEPTILPYRERVRLHLLIQDTWTQAARYALYALARRVFPVGTTS